MKQIEVEGYLTEAKLGRILHDIFVDVKRQHRVKISTKTCIVDYQFIIDGKEVFVEFNGDRHYREGKTQFRDILLRNHCKISGIILIEIPYFVQLDNYTKLFYFSNEIFKHHIDNVEITTNFPHGFVSDTCVLPCDFNIAGWNLFIREYEAFHQRQFDMWSISKEIYKSLEVKCEKLGYDDLVVGLSDPLHFLTPSNFFDFYPT